MQNYQVLTVPPFRRLNASPRTNRTNEKLVHTHTHAEEIQCVKILKATCSRTMCIFLHHNSKKQFLHSFKSHTRAAQRALKGRGFHAIVCMKGELNREKRKCYIYKTPCRIFNQHLMPLPPSWRSKSLGKPLFFVSFFFF